MTGPDKVVMISFKGFLFLIAGVFAIAAVVLSIFWAAAAPVIGGTPTSAVSLVEGVNTGVLGPGNQRWFRFKPNQWEPAGQVEQSLTLVFTPNDGNRLRKVAFQLFEEKQLEFFHGGDAGQMTNFGAGQAVSRDNNLETGEFFWTGWLFARNNYYIQVVNDNEIAIDYWLFTDDVINYSLGQPETPAVPEFTLARGAAPNTAIPLKFGANKGGLDPGQAIWYSFSMVDGDDEYFEEMALTMVTTPDDGNRIRHMTFDVFTAEGVRSWSPGDNSQIDNIGAGGIVVRDHNLLTGERFWHGWVLDKALYYIQIRNGADVHMDYWLFTGDIYQPELAEWER